MPTLPIGLLLCQAQHFLMSFFFLLSLYRGKVALDVAEAQHLMEGLDWQGAVKDIQASVKWLKSNGSPRVEPFVFVLVCSFVLCIGVCIQIFIQSK